MRLFGDPQKKKNAQQAGKIRSLVKEKKYSDALRVGQEYLTRVPDNHDVLFIMGGIHYMRKQYGKALKYFEAALQIGRYDTDVLILKAQCHMRLGQIQKARMCCEDILEVDPKNREARDIINRT